MREKIDCETRSHSDTQKKKDLENDIAKFQKTVDGLTLEIRNTKPIQEQTSKRRTEADTAVKNLENDKATLETKLHNEELAASRLRADNKNMTTDVQRVAFNLDAEKKILKELGEIVAISSEELTQAREKLTNSEGVNSDLTSQKLNLEKRLLDLNPLLKEALTKYKN